MQVTIVGVVNSDIIAAGEERKVEWTPDLRGLVQSGLVRVTAGHHPEPEPVRPTRRRASQADE